MTTMKRLNGLLLTGVVLMTTFTACNKNDNIPDDPFTGRKFELETRVGNSSEGFYFKNTSSLDFVTMINCDNSGCDEDSRTDWPYTLENGKVTVLIRDGTEVIWEMIASDGVMQVAWDPNSGAAAVIQYLEVPQFSSD